MTKRYIVQAQITQTRDGWRRSFGLPTFLLDGNIQGIISEAHAEQIARNLIISIDPNAKISLSVVGEEL
jgi:hypothetical protein